VPPTYIHTTSPDGALIVAEVGRAIGDGVGVAGAVVAGAVVGVGVGDAVAVADELAVGDGAFDVGDEHPAATSRIRTRKLPR
jgi:hypothetical protein